MNIILADDHKLIRDGLRPFLNDLDQSVTIREAGTFDELLQLGQELDELHLILTDLNMPGMRGINSLRTLVKSFADIPVVILSGVTDPGLIRHAIDVGVAGFIPKSSGSKVLMSALQLVLSGESYVPTDLLEAPSNNIPPKDESGTSLPGQTTIIVQAERFDTLSPRELGVLNLLAGGLTNKQIANEISVQEATIKIHVKNIYRKIGANNRAQAVRMALQPNWSG
ncbi:response regulator transcription factor [Magnetovibrio sp. PR-2]|uniref:response regulator transcription factor n=1 Tax=Magnetovibrio sp. PR-2 TaxID=3120356 RepID=UPI002FCE2525